MRNYRNIKHRTDAHCNVATVHHSKVWNSDHKLQLRVRIRVRNRVKVEVMDRDVVTTWGDVQFRWLSVRCNFYRVMKSYNKPNHIYFSSKFAYVLVLCGYGNFWYPTQPVVLYHITRTHTCRYRYTSIVSIPVFYLCTSTVRQSICLLAQCSALQLHYMATTHVNVIQVHDLILLLTRAGMWSDMLTRWQKLCLTLLTADVHQ